MKQTSLRDFVNYESMIKAFFIIYLKVNDFYISYSEREMNKGFADIILFPYYQNYGDMKNAYLIEIKYINRDFKGKKLKLELENKITEAKTQLIKYSNDDPTRKEFKLAPYGSIELKKIIIVFHAWDMIYCEEMGEKSDIT